MASLRRDTRPRAAVVQALCVVVSYIISSEVVTHVMARGQATWLAIGALLMLLTAILVALTRRLGLIR